MRTCDRTGCEARAKWFPRLVFGGTEDAVGRCVEATLKLGTCDAHKADAVVEQFMDDEGFAQFVRLFQQWRLPAPPIRERVRLEWQAAMWAEDN